METARVAVPGDLPRIVELAEAAATELAGQRGGAMWAVREARPAPIELNLSFLVQAEDALVVVGELDGVMLGYGTVRLEALRDGTTLGVVDDLYVEPEARGVGIGEAMMNLILEWCEARGCRGIDSLALPGERATKNFFERFGLTARAIVVHRSLGPHTTQTDDEGS